MSTSDDLLLLDLIFNSNTNNPSVHFRENDKNIDFLLPFSCTSIVASQLTVLTGNRPNSLIRKISSFSRNQKIKYLVTNYVASFNLEIYKRNSTFIFNQFNLQIGLRNRNVPNRRIEENIVNLIMNYIMFVFKDSDDNNKDRLLNFLLLTVSFFQDEILPIKNNTPISFSDAWKRLATTSINFNSEVYNRWEK